MRQFAGFGTAEETNERFRYLLDHGQTGPLHRVRHAVADGPRLGPPAQRGRGRPRGRRRSTRSTTWRRSSQGIPMGDVSTSMTINAPAAIMLAFYVVAGERQGIAAGAPRRHDPDRHPQGVHRPEGVVLPGRPGDAARDRHDRVLLAADAALAPGLDLRLPHPRGRARPPQQELAFTLKDGFTYVEQAIERGLDVDDFAPRLSFFFNAHIDFFEEIAKFRAARRIWARELRDTYGAKDPRSLLMRTHAQTAGRVAHRAAAAQQHRAHGHRGAQRACSAAPSRCTPTRTTRRSRCPPRRPCASRCARSRSSPTRPA